MSLTTVERYVLEQVTKAGGKMHLKMVVSDDAARRLESLGLVKITHARRAWAITTIELR